MSFLLPWKKAFYYNRAGFRHDPKEEDIVRENSVLLAIGSHEELSKLKKLAYQFNNLNVK